MIKIKSLTHRYDSKRQIDFADWEIADMEHWLLLGASGSGKSTLLNIVSGLLSPTQGTVNLGGTDLYSLPARKRDQFRGAHIGIVFQRPHLIRSLNVLENLELAALMAGLPNDHAHNLSLLDALAIRDESSKYPAALSQGQLQRVSVARALVNRPDVLIADEPTSSLDDTNARHVVNMLTTQAKNNGAALLIATHDTRISPFIANTYTL